MPRVIISGNYFPYRDIKYIDNGGGLDIIPFPKLDHITNEEIELLTKEANNADLLIVALFGTNPDKLARLGLERIHTNKALWTFDSHHGFEKERRFQQHFNTFFIAHSPYMSKFDGVRTEWVPDCFLRFDIDKLKELRLRSLFENNIKYDLAFPFKPYKIGNRLALAQKLEEYFKKIGIRYFLGPVESGMPYMNLILNSRVVLNISLLDDLNIRNFEAWGLNRPMLTNKVTDHDRLVDADFSTTYFFQRDLSDFDHMVRKALTGNRIVDTSVYVLNNHMLIHKYVEMINKSLGTDYSVRRFYENEPELVETTAWQI